MRCSSFRHLLIVCPACHAARYVFLCEHHELSRSEAKQKQSDPLSNNVILHDRFQFLHFEERYNPEEGKGRRRQEPGVTEILVLHA